jgi:hypothetical protein
VYVSGHRMKKTEHDRSKLKPPGEPRITIITRLVVRVGLSVGLSVG